MKEKIKYVEDTMIDIQSNMEKDQYKNLSKINERLKKLDELANANSTRISESNTVNTKTMTDAFNEIQQIKNNLKALGEDPNFLNRY